MMKHRPPVLDDVLRAADLLTSAGIARTPLVRFEGDADVAIYLKLENLQPIRSFKIRGMTNALAVADPAALTKGVWTVSAGNAAQGLGWAAARLGIPSSAVVPEGAPVNKIRKLEKLGTAVVSVSFEEWLDIAAVGSFAGVNGFFVHPFSSYEVMAGNATIGLEILEAIPDVRSIVVPWGGGGLACGIASAVRQLAPDVKVYASEFLPTAPLAESLDAGEPVTVPYQPSFIDGIGAPIVFPEMFELAKELLDGSLTVPLDNVRRSLRSMLENTSIVSEGAGAVSLATALTGSAGPGPVVCVVSGGNIDTSHLIEILSDGT